MKKLFRYIFIGVLAGLFLKLFVMDFPAVSGASMEPAIHDGQRIFISKLSYGLNIPFGHSKLLCWSSPQKDDVIVYMHDGVLVVKRCRATGGTPLDYSCNNGYTLLLGGEKIPLTEEQYRLLKNIHEVPQGMVLAVGDNYEASIDSRSYGFVPERDILGKVLWK